MSLCSLNEDLANLTTRDDVVTFIKKFATIRAVLVTFFWGVGLYFLFANLQATTDALNEGSLTAVITVVSVVATGVTVVSSVGLALRPGLTALKQYILVAVLRTALGTTQFTATAASEATSFSTNTLISSAITTVLYAIFAYSGLAIMRRFQSIKIGSQSVEIA